MPVQSRLGLRPSNLPAHWLVAADRVASGLGPHAHDPADRRYLDEVAWHIDRLDPDPVTRLLLSREQGFLAAVDDALQAHQSSRASAVRAADPTFLGPRSGLPPAGRLARSVLERARTNHVDNLVDAALDGFVKRRKATALRTRMMEVVREDLFHGYGSADDSHFDEVRTRIERADAWTTVRPALLTYYPLDDERAQRVLDRLSSIETPGGGPVAPEVPLDSAGNPDPVASAIRVGELKIEDVAAEAARAMTAKVGPLCPELRLPDEPDDDPGDRICAATNLITVRLLGESGMIFEAGDEARRWFQQGRLTAGIDLRVSLHHRTTTFPDHLDDVLQRDRETLYAALGFTPDPRASRGRGSHEAFAQLVRSLNGYTAARCQGRRCGRAAWIGVQMAIRRLRGQLVSALTENDVLTAASIANWFNHEVDILAGLVRLGAVAGATPGRGDVWNAVHALLGERADAVDAIDLHARAKAWTDLLALVSEGSTVEEGDVTVDPALDAAAFIEATLRT